MTEQDKILHQKLKFKLDTYPDKIRLLKQELREFEMGYDDARQAMQELMSKCSREEK